MASALRTSSSRLFARIPHLQVAAPRLVSTSAAPGAAAGVPPGAIVNIVGVSGSLRKSSRNTGLLRAILAKPPPGVNFSIADISDLPLYNDDLWQGGDLKNDDSALPASLRNFRAKIKAADVVLFSSPEYNFSITAPIKNAIDWCSKGPSLWQRKLVSVVGAAGGAQAARSALVLHSTLTHGCGAVYPPTSTGFVFSNAFSKSFDANGNVVDEALEKALLAHVEKVAAYAVKYKAQEAL